MSWKHWCDQFSQLRELAVAGSAADGPDADLLRPAAVRLNALRAKASGLVKALQLDGVQIPRNKAAAASIVGETWDELSSLPTRIPFSLPPLYPTADIKAEIRFAACALFAAESGIRPSASANAIFCGVRGTGKTTMLHGVGACAAVLLDKVIPVFHDFEADAGELDGPCELMARALERFGGEAAIALSAAVRHASDMESDPLAGLEALRTAGYTPLMLLDEFAVLYRGNDEKGSEQRARGIRFMRHLHTLCKQGRNVVALLATSRASVHDIFYPEATTEYPPAHCLLGYPNLNNQVFCQRLVRPIRDDAELAEYVQRRHSITLPYEGLTAAGIMHATGGCGRLVAQLLSGDVSDVVSVDEILRSPPLFALCAAMLSYAPAPVCDPLASDEAPTAWPIFSMPCKDAVDAIAAACGGRASDEGRAQARSLLLQYCDMGVAYINSSGELEPLVPAVLARVHARIRIVSI